MGRRDERGSSIPLLIAFTAVLVLLVAAVVDAGAAFLGHQQVDALADAAALRGADAGAEGDDTYASGVGRQALSLTESRARAGVLAYLREIGADRSHPGLRAEVHLVGDRLVVVLTAPVPLPLHLPGTPVRPVVRSEGSAAVLPDPNG